MAICSHIVSIFGKMTRSGYVMYTAVKIMELYGISEYFYEVC